MFLIQTVFASTTSAKNLQLNFFNIHQNIDNFERQSLEQFSLLFTYFGPAEFFFACFTLRSGEHGIC